MKMNRVLALTAATAVLASSAAVVAHADAPELTYQGTITMYAQALAPVEPTDTNPNPPTAFREVAAEWEAMHPGITIEFLDQVASDYQTWLRTKIAGGEAPDIIWQHYGNINGGALPKGATYDLAEVYQQPNPYVEGNEHWIDIFPETEMQMMKGPNGELPVVDADYVGTAVYYNVALFEAAGINMADYGENVDWSEYVDICEKLVAAGTTPWSFSFGNNESDIAYIDWFARLFNTNFYYNDFDNLAVVNPESLSLSTADTLVAYKNGDFGPDNPKWIAWWEIMKEQIEKYMPADAVSSASTRDTIQTQFLSGDIAMIWEGSWAPKNFAAAGCDFEIASFPFPFMDSAYCEYGTDAFVSGCVGGYLAAFHYAISTPQADNTMTDEKFAAVVDWLMFATTAENDSKICNDNGSFIPVVKGSVPSDANAGLVALMEGDAHVINDLAPLQGTSFIDSYYRTYQQYLRGDVTLEEAAESLRDELYEIVDEQIENIDEDLSAYIK